jgi:hypothetical protein
MKTVLNLVLSRQPAAAVSKMLVHWNRCVPNESILIAYGGTKSEFDAVQHKQKFFVDDRRLRTRDHQREFQSYTRLFPGGRGISGETRRSVPIRAFRRIRSFAAGSRFE